MEGEPLMLTRRSWLVTTLAAIAGVLTPTVLRVRYGRAAPSAADDLLDLSDSHDEEIAAFDAEMGTYDCAECGAYGAKRYPIEEPMAGMAWFPEGGYEAIPTQPVLHVKALCERCLYFRRMMVDRAALRWSPLQHYAVFPVT